MSKLPRVLLIGLRADVVDYSQWPGLTRERLEGGLAQVVEDMRARGIEAHWCLTDRGETATAVLREALADGPFDVVLVGAGVRLDRVLTPLMETIMNEVHQLAPSARIAFNTMPHDTVEAVERWLPGSATSA